MAYSSKETTQRFGEISKGKDTIVVTRITPDDKTKLESIDIRTFYTNDDDELAPTQKGVRFNSEIIPQVVKALLDAMTTEEFADLEELGYFVSEEIPDFIEEEENEENI